MQDKLTDQHGIKTEKIEELPTKEEEKKQTMLPQPHFERIEGVWKCSTSYRYRAKREWVSPIASKRVENYLSNQIYGICCPCKKNRCACHPHGRPGEENDPPIEQQLKALDLVRKSIGSHMSVIESQVDPRIGAPLIHEMAMEKYNMHPVYVSHIFSGERLLEEMRSA